LQRGQTALFLVQLARARAALAQSLDEALRLAHAHLRFFNEIRATLANRVDLAFQFDAHSVELSARDAMRSRELSLQLI